MAEERDTKKRNWAFVLYPESAPGDWRDRLTQTGLQCAVSPLHDRDTNADGTPKKAHYHVILAYNGPTSYSVVRKLTQDALCGTIPQPLEQIRGYYRYLTHKDNPEKVQYDERDITTINGFNIADFVELTRSEVDAIIYELQTLCRETGIHEYADLMDYVQDNMDMAHYSVASSHSIFFVSYLRSARYTRYDVPPFSSFRGAHKAQESVGDTNTTNTADTQIFCPECGSVSVMKYGKTLANTQRWRCRDCGKTWVE